MASIINGFQFFQMNLFLFTQEFDEEISNLILKNTSLCVKTPKNKQAYL